MFRFFPRHKSDKSVCKYGVFRNVKEKDHGVEQAFNTGRLSQYKKTSTEMVSGPGQLYFSFSCFHVAHSTTTTTTITQQHQHYKASGSSRPCPPPNPSGRSAAWYGAPRAAGRPHPPAASSRPAPAGSTRKGGRRIRPGC
jgi:hypothetical protein